MKIIILKKKNCEEDRGNCNCTDPNPTWGKPCSIWNIQISIFDCIIEGPLQTPNHGWGSCFSLGTERERQLLEHWFIEHSNGLNEPHDFWPKTNGSLHAFMSYE